MVDLRYVFILLSEEKLCSVEAVVTGNVADICNKIATFGKKSLLHFGKAISQLCGRSFGIADFQCSRQSPISADNSDDEAEMSS
jgi:hypothetical protein